MNSTTNIVQIGTWSVISGLIMCLLLGACQPSTPSNEDVVAQAGPYTLSKERVDQSYFHRMNPEDSADAVHQFIQQWAYDKAFEIEAMKQLKSRDELDQLIDAYRSSLITHLFEKQIIEQELDSVITADELQSYYTDNKGQYVLSSSILRLQFINIEREHPAIDQINQLWPLWERPSAMDSLIALCNESAEVFLLDDSVWYKLEELQAIVPGDVLTKESSSTFREQTFSNDTAMYFLRVLERIPDTEIAPLSFIERQARKVILHRRRQALIREKREKIYRDALKANRIKISN